MMFIDITAFKGAIEVENILTPYKRSAKITPAVCLDVLKSTNFKRNIRDMLECILKLPAAEQAAFKNVVLSTFDNREQPNEIVVLGKKLAAANGYEGELGEVAGAIREGCYLKSAVAADKWFATAKTDLRGEDFVAYDKVKITGKEFALEGAVTLPAKMDFSACDEVNLRWCDFANTQELKFKEGASVKLFQAKNLPADLDISMCNMANLIKCDFAGVKELKFKNKAKIYLFLARNLTADLDVSMCDMADLFGCHLTGVRNLKFKNKAQMEESSIKIPDGWEGNLIFAEEGENAMNIAALMKEKGGR